MPNEHRKSFHCKWAEVNTGEDPHSVSPYTEKCARCKNPSRKLVLQYRERKKFFIYALKNKKDGSFKKMTWEMCVELFGASLLFEQWPKQVKNRLSLSRLQSPDS